MFQIPVHCQKGADLLVSVYDSKGRKFDNFSSLAVDWKISDTSLLALDTPPDVIQEPVTLESGAKKVKGSNNFEKSLKQKNVCV